jgi:glycosyltransferase involved in cell wall biosynthesis
MGGAYIRRTRHGGHAVKVLLCHAYYTQRGGEDRSFEEERELLVAGGHEVVEYVRRNEDMERMGSFQALATTLWNRRAGHEVADLVRCERPDVMHCTNTFPLISPVACRAASQSGVAVVQALRNYRLLCANSYLMRDDRPCEECVGRAIPWPAVVHRCYRESALASAAVASMQVLHRTLGTWRRYVDAFFTLTEFARQKFVDAGLPADRVHVKFNSVQPDPGVGVGDGGYVAFAGRLSREKGVQTLLAAWQANMDLPPLRIFGDGPLLELVEAAARKDKRIQSMGRASESDVQRAFGNAIAVVVPSLWYETFGRTVAEAFAGGTPVVASRIGALAELVAPDRTGWSFSPGSAPELAAAVREAMQLGVVERAAMRSRARSEYEGRFTPQHNFARLMEIYEIAIEHAATRRAHRGISNGEHERNRVPRQAAISGALR